MRTLVVLDIDGWRKRFNVGNKHSKVDKNRRPPVDRVPQEIKTSTTVYGILGALGRYTTYRRYWKSEGLPAGLPAMLPAMLPVGLPAGTPTGSNPASYLAG